MTDPLGQSQVLPYLTGLSKLGYSFHLISAEKKDRLNLYRSEIEEICQNAGIIWHPTIYHNRPPVIGTLFDLIKIYFTAIRIFKNTPVRLVHCRSYIPSFIGIRLKHQFNIPYLFDMRGFWVNEKEDGKVWNLRNPVFRLIFRYMKGREKTFFNEADTVISLTNSAIPEIRKIFHPNRQNTRIQVIPCCVDTDFFNAEHVTNETLENHRKNLKIQREDFVISYLGSISTWYLPEEMLRFFKVLLSFKPEAKFLFITTEDPAFIHKLAELNGVQRNKIIITSASRTEVREKLLLSNASIFFIKPAFSKIASSPTKLGELLSLGIPVICNSGIGDTDEIIRKSEAGIICSHFDDQSYQEVVKQLLAQTNTNNAVRLRQAAQHLFSLKKGVISYETVYQHLLRNDDKAHFAES